MSNPTFPSSVAIFSLYTNNTGCCSTKQQCRPIVNDQRAAVWVVIRSGEGPPPFDTSTRYEILIPKSPGSKSSYEAAFKKLGHKQRSLTEATLVGFSDTTGQNRWTIDFENYFDFAALFCDYYLEFFAEHLWKSIDTDID